jgi:hypothetical protein
VYALVCHLELSRIVVNDVTRELIVSDDDRGVGQRAAIQVLLATVIKLAVLYQIRRVSHYGLFRRRNNAEFLPPGAHAQPAF